MKTVLLWLVSVISLPIFLVLWVLYLFVIEPLCWLCYAPWSVWAGAKVLVKKFLTGKE